MNVVSFFAPRPEHPYFQDYRPYLAILRLSCARFGHKHLVLTDDPMEVGDDDAYPVDLPRSLMKAVLAAQLAYLSDPAMANEPTLLVGADCVLANDPERFREVGGGLVITVGDFADCRMNTGAIFVPRPSEVAPIWRAALGRCADGWGDDQTSLLAAIDTYRDLIEVRELPVDPFNLAPVHPGDDCTRGVVLHFRGARKAWMTNYCHQWLGLGEAHIAVALPNTEPEILRQRILATLARDLPEVRPADAHDGHAVLVGGGPSLAEMLPEILRRANDGQMIFALNGTADYLWNHGIPPDYCVVLDARPENARFVRSAFATQYLLASQCHRDVFDAAPPDRVLVWHSGDKDTSGFLPVGHYYAAGNITVGLTAMSLAFMMGYRKLHLYGYDSSDREDAAHAYAQGEDNAERKRVMVWCDGRPFTAGIAMYAQAQAFPALARLLTDLGVTITVHGDGLLPTLARTMVRPIATTEDIAA